MGSIPWICVFQQYKEWILGFLIWVSKVPKSIPTGPRLTVNLKNQLSVKPRNSPYKKKFGFAATIHISSRYANAWTVGLRFPKNLEPGIFPTCNFQVFNAQFQNVFETEAETILLLTQKLRSEGKLWLSYVPFDKRRFVGGLAKFQAYAIWFDFKMIL